MNLPPIVRYQLPVFLWIVTIFALSSLPSIAIPKFPLSPDKFAHAGIYFVLCMLWERALLHQSRVVFFQTHALSIAFCLSAVHGMLDEVYQMSVPGRSADVFDAAADIAGAGLFVIWSMWRRRLGGKENLT